MKKTEKRTFNPALYSVIAGVCVAVVLIIITVFAFTTRYTAFDADKVAVAYTDSIVQTGDGYNAYKNTLVSKNKKYGDFIREVYMAPYVNEEAPQADFVLGQSSMSEEETQALSTVYSTMYDYYISLISTYGYDNYDAIFSNYFSKLCEVRQQVYGDEYMDTEFMFGAFEANVSAYGQSLTGTDLVIADDEKTVLQEESTGAYQTMYGTDYKLTVNVADSVDLTADEVKSYVSEYSARISEISTSGEERAANFGLDEKQSKAMVDTLANLDCTDNISAVKLVTLNVTLADGTVVANQGVHVVQIGKSWYVDETNVDTSGLYLAL